MINYSDNEPNYKGQSNDDPVYVIDEIDIRLPCQYFEIQFQERKAGYFNVAIEFLLRLLNTLGELSEIHVSQFFAYSFEDTTYVISEAKNRGYIGRNDGKLYLTPAGKSHFDNKDEPIIKEVSEKKELTFCLDLISYCSAKKEWISDFDKELSSIEIGTKDQKEKDSLVIDSFQKNFSEFLEEIGYSDEEIKKTELFTVYDINPGGTGECLIPVKIELSDQLTTILPSIIDWKSGNELQQRLSIKTEVDQHISNLMIEKSMEEIAPSFIGSKRYLLKCAPQLLDSYFSRSTTIDVLSYVKKAFRENQKFCSEVKTIITFGTLWTQRNTDIITSAIESSNLDNRDENVIVWLRPATKHWGKSRQFYNLYNKILGRKNKNLSYFISPYSHDICDSLGNKKIRLNEENYDRTSTDEIPPSNFEMLLVPGKFFAANLYLKLPDINNYPISVGLISIDRKYLENACEVTRDILKNNCQETKETEFLYDELQFKTYF